MKNSPKIAIQASLAELDSLQAEQVLDYIKGLLQKPRKTRDYYEFKRKALNEIRQALNTNGGLKMTA
ncbi:MAG TPA: hypothetical protein VFE57_07250 [Cyclobacteriaceae bacterium]|jgi:hypothetical protein|nr:hypothetical protein [Cyclobacteriaceae bacterium]